MCVAPQLPGNSVAAVINSISSEEDWFCPLPPLSTSRSVLHRCNQDRDCGGQNLKCCVRQEGRRCVDRLGREEGPVVRPSGGAGGSLIPVPFVGGGSAGASASCGLNEERDRCVERCPRSCEQPQAGCGADCDQGSACVCRPGFVRETADPRARCVRPDQCPNRPACTDPNKVYSSCANAEGCPTQCNGNGLRCPRSPCVAGCVCREPLLFAIPQGSQWNSSAARCVNRAQCPLPVQDQNDLVSLLSREAKFGTLVAAVREARLVTTLRGSGPFTVLAPTAAAFARVADPAARRLVARVQDQQSLSLAERDQLSQLLQYHVIPGTLRLDDLRENNVEQSFRTAAGTDVRLQRNFQIVRVNGGARLGLSEIRASNGLILELDSVLSPPAKSQQQQCRYDNQVYEENGSDCPASCDDQSPSCNFRVASGCKCAAGYLFASANWRNSACVRPTECGSAGGLSRVCPTFRANRLLMNSQPCRQDTDCSSLEMCCADQNVNAKRCVCHDNLATRKRDCVRSCDNLEALGRGLTCASEMACHCQPGYVWNRDPKVVGKAALCIPQAQCDNSDPGRSRTCADRDKVFRECGSSCPQACDTPRLQACTRQCVPGCFCRDGYVLESAGRPEGRCVLRATCPSVGLIREAVAEVFGAGRSRLGQLQFTRRDGQMRIQGRLTGLSAGRHGVGIAEFGNCRDPGERLNPGGRQHGDPASSFGDFRAGDLGNVDSVLGTTGVDLASSRLNFTGASGIVGRSFVVHEAADDGRSADNGNAGSIVACGVIGIRRPSG